MSIIFFLFFFVFLFILIFFAIFLIIFLSFQHERKLFFFFLKNSKKFLNPKNSVFVSFNNFQNYLLKSSFPFSLFYLFMKISSFFLNKCLQNLTSNYFTRGNLYRIFKSSFPSKILKCYFDV